MALICASCGHENREVSRFCTDCGQRLDTAAEPAQPTPQSFANGRYTVSKLLGEGGKKRVYLAHDETLDRDVAFALIKTEGLGDAARTRITREAQAMGRLGDHPHIVQIYDLDQEDGQPYMVLPVLPGGDVEGLIEQAPNGRVPLADAVRIAIETCRGLEFAHSKGVIHRDLKPGNVWLTADGTAKIGDFGLAITEERSRLTQEGMMVGTVSYMPPEQAMGGEVTARSDLYSLGAMLYELVTGRPPFVGDDAVAIIGQHLNTAPVAPTWHNPACPSGLEALVLRLLEKDPASRPATAAEVREALESIDLTTARPEPVEGREGPASQNPLYRRTFVGREREVAQLHQAFDAALSGEGGLAMVVGEPGIGKTTLTEQLSTYVSLRGGKTLVGHCYEEGSLSLPYLAFVEAMRTYVLQRDPAGLRDDLGTGAGDVARIVSEIRDRVQVEPRDAGDPDDDRYRLLQAVTDFLRHASMVQPLCVVLEDLHDADRGTLDMLVHVARNLSGARLLIIGTYRDVQVDRAHQLSNTLAELRRGGSFTRVPLRGLTVDEVHRLVVQLSGNQDVPWSFAEAVHRQTEGNPLFIQEVLRYLLEEGLVAREGGQFRRVGDEPLADQIPEGLRDVIGKRMTRLGEGANQVLGVAAVIGREFRLDVIERVAGVTEDELFAALEEAQGVGVVEQRSGVATGVTFRFTHAFFRQTLYEEMFAPRRIRFHQQVGRALEEVHERRLGEHAAEIAEHFAQSTERDDLEKALRYSEISAERARDVYAWAEGARLLEQALQVQEVLDPEDQPKRCDLLIAQGQALLPGGEPLRVGEALAPEAFALAEGIGDDRRAFSACWLALEGLTRYGANTMWGTPAFLRWAERADHYALPETSERAYADVALASARFARGGYAEASVLRRRARDFYRRNTEGSDLASPALLGVQEAPKYAEDRLVVARETVASESEYGISMLQATSLWSAGLVLLENGDLSGAEAAWDRQREAGERGHDLGMLRLQILRQAVTEAIGGRMDVALDLIDEWGRRSEEAGMGVGGRQLGANTALRPLLHLGRAQEALEVTEGDRRVRAAAAGGPPPLMPPPLLHRVALCLAHLGRHDEAREVLHEFMDRLGIGPGEDDGEAPAAFFTNLLETAVLIGDEDVARILAQRLIPSASSATGGLAQTTVARHLAAAAAMLGEPDQARAYYQQALDAAGTIGFRPEIALTRLQLAELLLAQSQQTEAAHPEPVEGRAEELRREAIEHLDFAIAELRDMKMQPSLERALRHRDILKA